MTQPLPQTPQIAIIGTGLLGTSIGLGLKARGYTGQIIGLGRSLPTPERARAVGGVDQATTDFAVLRDCGLAIVCVPLGGFAAVFDQIAEHDHPGLTLTDVGSTKLSVLRDARNHLPDATRFVGSHPMAGKEQQGPDAADGDLFVGKPCILTAETDTNAEAVALVESLWQTLGMPLLQMSAEDHDAQTAAVSHLPHAAAVLLVQTAMRLGGWDVASTGFCDTTRLASSNPPMRADILMANREPVLKALDEYRNELDLLRDVIDRGDAEHLLDWLTEAKSRREAWLAEREAKKACDDLLP